MEENYNSILVTIRSKRADVYSNGLPLLEYFSDDLIHVTSKKSTHDLENMIPELNSAIYILNKTKEEIEKKILNETTP